MYIGLDVHKRLCYGTVTDDQGRIVRSGKFSSNPEGLKEFMDGLEKAQVAMEVGYCWQPLYNGLLDAGHDVRLANPQKVKAIAEAKVKTDNHNEPYISISSPSPSLSFNLSLSRGWHTTIRGSTPSSTIRPYEAHPYSSFGDGPQSVFQGDNSS